ncbi:methylated-DNA--[protein]-cysteine S-methyltransferase [uncultured Draconibacterium sp.]|uniref:methylated-DNA--[protein]-cysteine S-methyltransferase n=1 Tax=uncultured Draconibacterium sp. TaxID=1573823 RepID=UPI0025E9CD4B|nr:methylated-DNA--[protein]-cysteine S-methyltransferase [uncultured Draconibacterium sp.]
MKQFTRYIPSPIGWLRLLSSEKALTSIKFVDACSNWSEQQPIILGQTAKQLEAYFQGNLKSFNLQLEPEGTLFQQKIWKLVQGIEYGATASYLEIARQSGSEKNTRAVGFANGKNPIPIIIPCHRIIGSSGKLTGYAGGIERKRWLLNHERTNTKIPGQLF